MRMSESRNASQTKSIKSAGAKLRSESAGSTLSKKKKKKRKVKKAKLPKEVERVEKPQEKA